MVFLTTIAVTIGTVLALLIKPGTGAAHYIASNIASDVQASVATATQQQQRQYFKLIFRFYSE